MLVFVFSFYWTTNRGGWWTKLYWKGHDKEKVDGDGRLKGHSRSQCLLSYGSLYHRGIVPNNIGATVLKETKYLFYFNQFFIFFKSTLFRLKQKQKDEVKITYFEKKNKKEDRMRLLVQKIMCLKFQILCRSSPMNFSIRKIISSFSFP